MRSKVITMTSAWDGDYIRSWIRYSCAHIFTVTLCEIIYMYIKVMGQSPGVIFVIITTLVVIYVGTNSFVPPYTYDEVKAGLEKANSVSVKVGDYLRSGKTTAERRVSYSKLAMKTGCFEKSYIFKYNRRMGQCLWLMNKNTIGLRVKPSFAPLPFPSLWVYETILPKHMCHFKQLLIISKSTKYFDILFLITCEPVLPTPSVQIWAQNSTILPPNNLLVVRHSSIMSWSQNTLTEFKLMCLHN